MKCPTCQKSIIFKNTNVISHKCGEQDISYSKSLTNKELIANLRSARKNGYSTISITASSKE